MFNSEQKERFLEYASKFLYNESTCGLIKSMFNRVEMAERQNNKDVIEFNNDEVVDMLRGFNSKSPNRLAMMCSYLGKYYEWAYVENITNSIVNPFDARIVDSIIADVIPIEDLNKKYMSRVRILELMENVKDDSNKFIFYAVYNGLKAKEIVNLKMSDLNGSVLTLSGGRKKKVDDLFIDLMRRVDMANYYLPDGIGKTAVGWRQTYCESSYILKRTGKKDVDDSPLTANSIKTGRMRVIAKQCNNEFVSAPMLALNGVMHYIKDKFAEKNISLQTAFMHKTGKAYTYVEEIENYMREYGVEIAIRTLRRDVKNYLDLF